MELMKVKCIKSATLGALDLALVEGEEYDVPAKVVSDYPQYFKKKAGRPKTKKSETEENK